LSSLDPDLHIVLRREIPSQESIYIIGPVIDGRKLLFQISLFHTTMGVKDVYGKSLAHPMYDIEIVRFDCPRYVEQKRENSQAMREPHCSYSV
jgi:hypothetical protein